MAVILDDFDLDQLLKKLENDRYPHQQGARVPGKEIDDFLKQLETNGEVKVSKDGDGDDVYTFDAKYRDEHALTEALKPQWANFKEAAHLAEQRQYKVEQNQSYAPQTPLVSSRDSGFFEEMPPHSDFDTEKSEETHVQHDVDHSDFGNPSSPADEAYLAEQRQYNVEQNQSNPPQTPLVSNRDSGFFEETPPHFNSDTEKPEETHVEHGVDYTDVWNPSAPAMGSTFGSDAYDIDDSSTISSARSESRNSSRSFNSSTATATTSPATSRPTTPGLSTKVDAGSTVTKQESPIEDAFHIGAEDQPTTTVVLTYATSSMNPDLMEYSTTSTDLRVQALVTATNKFTSDIANKMQNVAENPAQVKELTDSLNERYNDMIVDIANISDGVQPQVLQSSQVQTTKPSSLNSSISTAPTSELSRSSSPSITSFEDIDPSADEFSHVDDEIEDDIEEAQIVEATVDRIQVVKPSIIDYSTIFNSQANEPSADEFIQLEEAKAARVVASTEIRGLTVSNSQAKEPSAHELTLLEEAKAAQVTELTDIDLATTPTSQPTEPLVITHTPYEGDSTLKIHSTTSPDPRIKKVVDDANKFTIDAYHLMQRAERDGNVEKLPNLIGAVEKHYQAMESTIAVVHGRQPTLQAQATAPLPATPLSQHSPTPAPQPEQPQNSPTAVDAIESYKITDPTFGDAYTVYTTKDPSEQSQRFVDQANAKVSELLTITRNSIGNPDAYNTNSKLLNSYYNEVNKAVAAFNDRKRHPLQQHPTQAVIDHDVLALAAAQKYVKENMRAANGAHQFSGGINPEALTEQTEGEHTLVPVHMNDTHTWGVEVPHPSKNPPQKRFGKLLKAVTSLLLQKLGKMPVIGEIIKVDMSRSQNQTQDQSQHIAEGQAKKPGKAH
ncbi:MAG: hypothetical protein V4568_08900 [Pseudomonadota bacterium]